MSTEKIPKNPQDFSCLKCDYYTSNKKDFQKHINTNKHKINISSTFVNNLSTSLSHFSQYQCEKCNKTYKERTGLWRHKKKCNETNFCHDNISNNISDKDLIMMFIKQNTELMEILKNNTNTCQIVNNTNCNNKSFNLNLFLNETCKNAMNITDFVDSIKLQLSDLENIGEMGYVKGISDIITTNLKALDITQRPIHCTDKKRETLYIKDENKWEKEDENKNKLRKVIKKVANKNAMLIQEFKKKYPDCIKSTSKFSDKYNKIIIEAMGGPGDNDIEKEDKIIKNISNVTILNKSITN